MHLVKGSAQKKTAPKGCGCVLRVEKQWNFTSFAWAKYGDGQ